VTVHRKEDRRVHSAHSNMQERYYFFLRDTAAMISRMIPVLTPSHPDETIEWRSLLPLGLICGL